MKEVIMQIQSFSADYPKAPIYVGDLIRCKDCRYRKKVSTSYYCEFDEFNVKDTDFCSWGERSEKE